jgi:hypothetical protein
LWAIAPGRLRDVARVTGPILLGFRSENRGGGDGRKPLASADAAKGMRALGMHAEEGRKPLASADAAKHRATCAAPLQSPGRLRDSAWGAVTGSLARLRLSYRADCALSLRSLGRLRGSACVGVGTL